MSALMRTTHTHEEHANAEELQNLHAQLEKLITHNLDALKSEQVIDDVEKLLRWVERCEEGSEKAERILYNKGVDLLTQVKEKLKLALEEELRIIDESPAVAQTAKGRTADRLTKASRRADEALSTLSEIAESK